VVAPLLNLTKSGSGSDAIYKVAVAHLCGLISFQKWMSNVGPITTACLFCI